MKTMVSIKLDPRIKKEAQRAAEDLGLTLSAVVNAQLHEFARAKELHVSAGLRPTPYMERVLRQAEKNWKEKKNISGPFNTVNEFRKHLERDA